MPTRNFYVAVSRRLGPYQRSLKYTLLVTWLGGFAVLGVIAVVLKAPVAFALLGKLWFTLCMLLGIAYLCVHMFSPERDPLDTSPAESWAAIVFNVAVLLTAWVWFWKD